MLTLHGRLDLPSAQRLLPMYPEISLVSISDHQRRALDGLGVSWAATVPNGLDLEDYHRQHREAGTHLAFVGRICSEKRPDLAVEIAHRTGRRLQVAAKVDPTDEEYFAESIEPLFDRYDVEYVGELGERHKPGFYAAAAATLFPSDWPEPFGLVMIESLAAGTPVIALRRGAVPEVIEHGVSGSSATTSTRWSPPSTASVRSIPPPAVNGPVISAPTRCAPATNPCTPTS